MLLVKALHIIAMVAWFAGLFYLPRLFVYHAGALDAMSISRFKTMESRLYYAITWPAALLTTLFGFMLIYLNPGYLQEGWMHAKLLMVLLLWWFHFSCGYYLKRFAKDDNQKTQRFFRLYNELPTVLLIGIVLTVVMKPF